MDNAQKAIMIGVGLFITIIIISAVLLIFGLGNSLTNDGTAELDKITSAMQNRLTSEFEFKTMSGARVLSTIKEYENSSSVCIALFSMPATPISAGSNKIFKPVARTGAKAIRGVYIVKNTSPSSYIGGTILTGAEVRLRTDVTNGLDKYKLVDWGNTNDTRKTSYKEFTDPTSAAYINPGKQYISALIRNTDKTAIIGIAFQEVPQ